MNIGQMLGPEGVQQRSAELQKKLDQFFGGPSFDTFVSSAPKELSGAIGANTPFDPMGPGAKVNAPEPSPDMRQMITEAANQSGIDPQLFDALVAVESGYDTAARSHAGALGLTQLMPGTAKSLGVDPLDPKQSLRGGAQYLAQLLKQFGSADIALAAYNAGPGAVQRAGNNIPNNAETQDYVKRVMAVFNARKTG